MGRYHQHGQRLIQHRAALRRYYPPQIKAMAMPWPAIIAAAKQPDQYFRRLTAADAHYADAAGPGGSSYGGYGILISKHIITRNLQKTLPAACGREGFFI